MFAVTLLALRLSRREEEEEVESLVTVGSPSTPSSPKRLTYQLLLSPHPTPPFLRSTEKNRLVKR